MFKKRKVHETGAGVQGYEINQKGAWEQVPKGPFQVIEELEILLEMRCHWKDLCTGVI